jgi:glutamate racemase
LDKSSPILLFDSGVGGLTVYDALRKILPDASVIYAADFSGLPYGTKTEAQVAARVAGLLGRMSERFRPRLACIACNTASTIALGTVREVLAIPIVGTVPAIKPAALATQTGAIGLLGTQATIRQLYVDELEREFAAGKSLVRHAAPALVDEAEAKLRGRPVDRAVLAEALRGVSEAGGVRVDQVVLGCTHFPLLSDELADVARHELGMAAPPAFLDGAAGIARRIAHLLEGQVIAPGLPSRFVVTGPPSAALGLEAALAARGLTGPERF